MRIQDTDRILKEARVARHNAVQPEEEGIVSRTWRRLTSLFRKS